MAALMAALEPQKLQSLANLMVRLKVQNEGAAKG